MSCRYLARVIFVVFLGLSLSACDYVKVLYEMVAGSREAEMKIDFKSPVLPDFVESLKGFSGVEPTGRWTEADTKNNKSVITFKSELPETFTLELTVGGAFGPNLERSSKVVIGDIGMKFKTSGGEEVYRFEFKGLRHAKTIEIVPAKATSPLSIGKGNDPRLLGIMLLSLRLLPLKE